MVEHEGVREMKFMPRNYTHKTETEKLETWYLEFWRCMYRASSYNMCMNQQDAQNSCD